MSSSNLHHCKPVDERSYHGHRQYPSPRGSASYPGRRSSGQYHHPHHVGWQPAHPYASSAHPHPSMHMHAPDHYQARRPHHRPNHHYPPRHATHHAPYPLPPPPPMQHQTPPLHSYHGSIVAPSEPVMKSGQQQPLSTPSRTLQTMNSDLRDENNPNQDFQRAPTAAATPMEAKPTPKPTSRVKYMPPFRTSDNMLKSPVTMCFERFLGAANYISKHPLSGIKKPLVNNSVRKVGIAPIIEEPVIKQVAAEKQTSEKREDAGDSTEDVYEVLSNDLNLQRQVVLCMALQRLNNDDRGAGTSDSVEPPSKVIREGFFWKDYTPCEQVLYDHMAEYYDISCLQRQSKLQQTFNNMLVREVRAAATEAGISFETTFVDKKLRDRIRCFYKTHLQNAKKRLATLMKHPASASHKAALRVFVRCVRLDISLEKSMAMEPPLTSANGKKVRRPLQSILDKASGLRSNFKAPENTLS